MRVRVFLLGRIGHLKLQMRVRIKRRQVVEADAMTRFVRVLEIDCVDLEKSKITLAFLGRADFAFDRIAGAQIEFPHLAGRDINIVGARQIIGFWRAQEAEAVWQNFQHAVAIDRFSLGSPIFFRMANIISCLRIALASSIACCSAIAKSSAGVLLFNSRKFMET